MMKKQDKQPLLSFTMAHASALKQQGFYMAAKSLLRPLLILHPQHKSLQALYERIEWLQQKKIKQKH